MPIPGWTFSRHIPKGSILQPPRLPAGGLSPTPTKTQPCTSPYSPWTLTYLYGLDIHTHNLTGLARCLKVPE